MTGLDAFFAFKIGDTARLKVHIPGYDKRGNKFTPQVLVVVERMLTECYGGVQAHYGMRVHQHLGGGLMSNEGYSFLTDLIRISEPELTALDLPPLADEPPPPPPRPRRDKPTTEGDTDNAAI